MSIINTGVAKRLTALAANLPNITLGSDMEFFVIDNDTGNTVISQGRIPGSKEQPQQLADGIVVHRDNCLGEFTINPADNPKQFVKNCLASRSLIDNLLAPLNLSTRFSSYFHFDVESLQDPECMTFGCQPDFSAFTGEPNPSPDPWEIGGQRSAGGHIHIGYDSPNEKLNLEIIKIMDFLVGALLALNFEGSSGHARRAIFSHVFGNWLANTTHPYTYICTCTYVSKFYYFNNLGNSEIRRPCRRV